MTTDQKVAALLAGASLAEALEAAAAGMKSAPQDMPLRRLFIDLLILAGDFERADKQAAMGMTLAPQDSMSFALLRHRIRGMDARAAWYEKGAVPSFPGGPTPLDALVLKLNLAVGAGEVADVASLLAETERHLADRPARWNDAAATEFRDLDDLLPHALEVVTSGGAYLWVDFARLRRVTFEPPRRSLELAYRRAMLELEDGSAAEVLVPAIYHVRPGDGDGLRLGRETDWVEQEGGIVSGRGQRCYLVGDTVHPIMEAVSIETLSIEVGAAVDG